MSRQHHHHVSTPGMAPQDLVDAIHNPYAYMWERLTANPSKKEKHHDHWDPTTEDVKKLHMVLKDILSGAVEKQSTEPHEGSTLYTLYQRSSLHGVQHQAIFKICKHGCIHPRTVINVGFTGALHEFAKVVELAWSLRNRSVKYDGEKAFQVPNFNYKAFRGISPTLLPNDMLACRMYAWACGPLFLAARGKKVQCCDINGRDMVTPYIESVDIIHKTRGDWRFRITWQGDVLNDIEWLAGDTKAVMGLYREDEAGPTKLGYLVAETFYDMINEQVDVREAMRQGPRALVVKARPVAQDPHRAQRLLQMLDSRQPEPRQPPISEEKRGQEEGGGAAFMEAPEMSILEGDDE